MGIKDNIQVPFFPEMNGGRDTMNNFFDSICFTFSSGNVGRNEKFTSRISQESGFIIL